ARQALGRYAGVGARGAGVFPGIRGAEARPLRQACRPCSTGEPPDHVGETMTSALELGIPRLALAALSPGGAQGRLSILIFHRVLPVPDPLFPGEVDARRFDELLGWFRAWLNVLPLDEAVCRLKA